MAKRKKQSNRGQASRVTPKSTDARRESPMWRVALMLTLLIAGVVVIILNQTGYLPGGAQGRYLALGFTLFAAGFFTTTTLY